MMRNKLTLLVHLGVVATLLALAVVRLRGDDMERPFETDELLTVRYYTWVGAQPSGEPRRLDRIDDLRAVAPPERVQLAMALYCGLGRWPEPNNHVVNSLLVSAALAVGERDERCARAPALIGAVVLAGAMYFLCAALLGWRIAAPLVVAWAWFFPYTVAYSQTARGFSWMQALEALMILLAYLLARRPGSLALGVLGAAAGALSLMNVVNMSVDWLVPYYLALYFFPPTRPGSAPLPVEGRAAFRRAVLVQVLVVAAIGAVFFVTRLPSLYSSARQYGLEFHSVGGFFERAVEVFDGLFPDVATKAFALAGAGGVWLGLDRRYRFLGALAALLVVINLLHFAAGGRFPYPRAAGHVIPLVLLGAAYLAERVIRVFETAVGRALMFATLALLTLGWAAAPPVASLESKSLSACLALAARAKVPPGSQVHVPVRTGIEYLIAAYGPPEWERVEAVAPGAALTVLLFDPEGLPTGQEDLRFLVGPRYRLTRLSGPTRPLTAEGPLPAGAWVFWYPEFTALGVDAKEQRAFVERSGCPVLPSYARYQVKFDVHSHLHGFIFLAERADAGKAAEVVRQGLRRFGGRAVVFVPTQTETLR